jgi:D-alanyl-D-alanine dipeptidase
MSILKKKSGEHPVEKVVLPKEVEKVGNGNLTPKMLATVKCGGKMWTKAAEAFNALYDEALAAGHKLRNVGDYRPFGDQLAMFNDRYSAKDQGRKPQITRNYEGKVWYLKPGKAPSGTPGTSNHGFGLAIDVGIEVKGKLLSIGGTKAYDWMCENAPRFGFYLQGAPTKDGKPNPEYEAWHWQYCLGDKQPPYLSEGAAPAPASAAGPRPAKLTVGDKGEHVKALQEALKKAGHYAGPASGDFDAATGEAVKKLKAANGLKADAIAGGKVFELLGM